MIMWFKFLLFILTTLVSTNCDQFNVVIDLKYANEYVDFIKVKNAGVKGVIHMVTLGANFQDPTYAQRKKEALSVGLLWGAYHISDGSSGSEQAMNFLKTVGDDDSILLAIGIEESNYSMNSEQADDFIKTVYQARKRYPLAYGQDYLVSLVKEEEDSLLTKCGLWTFQYQDNVTVPEGWKDWALWQYTDGQHGPQPHGVDGVGPCGRDTINSRLYPDVESLWKNY